MLGYRNAFSLMVVYKGGRRVTADCDEGGWEDAELAKFEVHEHKMLRLSDNRRKGPQRGLLNIVKAFGDTDAAAVIDSKTGMLLVKVEIDNNTAQQNKEAAIRFAKRLEAPYATWDMRTIHTMYDRFKVEVARNIKVQQQQQQQMQQPSASSPSLRARPVKKKPSAAASSSAKEEKQKTPMMPRPPPRRPARHEAC